MLHTRRYASPVGGLTLTADDDVLTGLSFDDRRRAPAPEREGGPSPALDEAVRWLDIYFAGGIPDFTPPLRPEGTAFRKRVWALLQDIPYGQTVTYGDIAARLSAQPGAKRASARAVGGAVGRNPIALIVPCHRVVGAGGALTGYGGGLDRKRFLLALERGE